MIKWSVGALVVMLAGCGHAAPPTTTSSAAQPDPSAGDIEVGAHTVECHYDYKDGKVTSTPDQMHSLAMVELDRAATLMDAGDPLTAARRYMACAAIYREAPDTDDAAAYNAEVCYYNAAYAFATAGAFVRVGAAELEAAAAADPRRASYVRTTLLAEPPTDCAPTTP